MSVEHKACRNRAGYNFKGMSVCGYVSVWGAVDCTFSLHAHSQTLLKAAERTTFPLGKVHGAALLFRAGVMLVILH